MLGSVPAQGVHQVGRETSARGAALGQRGRVTTQVEATQKENEVLRGKCAALQERLLEMG